MPWIFPVPWIDALINHVALPLIVLLFIVILGVFFRAIIVIKGRKQKLIGFMLGLLYTILTIGGLNTTFAIAMIGAPAYCDNTPVGQTHAVDWALSISGLLELPPSAHHVQAISTGVPLARTVVVHFEAERSAVEKWLTASQLPSIIHRLPDGGVAYEHDGGNTSVNLTVSGGRRIVDLRVSQWI